MPKPMKLPKELVVFHNADKVRNESWLNQKKRKNFANFPAPFRLLMIAKPNCGKTNLIKNIISHQRPDFERIMIATPQGDEYEDMEKIGCEMFFDRLPSEDEIREGRDKKQCLIIDDINLKKEDQDYVTKLLRNLSSHNNLSVMMSCHDPNNLHVSHRRMFDIVCLFKHPDKNNIAILARKNGLTKEQFEFIFFESDPPLLPDPYSFLTIDLLNHSPAPLRIGLWDKLEIKKVDGVYEYTVFKENKENI